MNVTFKLNRVLKHTNRPRKDTFHNAVRPIMLITHMLGLMPIRGLISNDVKRLKFKWFSISAIYSLIVFIYIVINGILAMRVVSELGLELGSGGNEMFLYIIIFCWVALLVGIYITFQYGTLRVKLEYY